MYRDDTFAFTRDDFGMTMQETTTRSNTLKGMREMKVLSKVATPKNPRFRTFSAATRRTRRDTPVMAISEAMTILVEMVRMDL
jgi:hypothetical protein